MAIANKEVRIKLGQIQRDLTHSVCAIDQTENSILSAHFGDSLKRESDPRDRHNGFEDADLWREAIVQDARYRL